MWSVWVEWMDVECVGGVGGCGGNFSVYYYEMLLAKENVILLPTKLLLCKISHMDYTIKQYIILYTQLHVPSLSFSLLYLPPLHSHHNQNEHQSSTYQENQTTGNTTN